MTGKPRGSTAPEVKAEHRRLFGSASAYTAAFYNDALILDMPIVTPTDTDRAAARRVLEAHDALDLAVMLGLDADEQAA